MSLDVQAGRDDGWREAGRKIAPLLRGCTAAVVTGLDERAAAFIALGIAETEAPYHSVVIANLWGTQEVDHILDAEEDAPGISECFTYGISLASAARPSPANARLEIIGGGSEPFDSFSVFRSRRWKAFAERLLEAGTLLLLVTPADADPISELIAQVDGIILVGLKEVPSAPNARTIATVMDPVVRRQKPDASGSFSWKRTAAVLAILLVIGGAVAASLGYFWLRQSTASRRSMPSAAGAVAIPGALQTAVSSTAATAPAQPSIANPADSIISTAFSVEILAANTQSGAIFTLQKYRASIPAGTVSAIPVGPDQALWYKVIGGAFANREEADSLLVALRRKRIIPAGSGSVVETPLAFLVDSIAPDAGMATRIRKAVDTFPNSGFPLYGLVQNDGSALIYAGAFSLPSEAGPFAEQLKAAGLNATLVYRTGRNP